ncbi:MAG TPA: ATP-grasp domain-containing protein [Anaerolineae bacterium]|nr:ATP-grasp domain-containing protein [Anaerolineae bacterium]
MLITLINDSLEKKYSEKEEITIESHHNTVIESIISATLELGYEIVCLEANQQLEERLIFIKPQIAFNRSIRKNNNSKHALAPHILEKLEIPYTGSSSKVCINAFEKLATKEILKNAGIPTPKYCVISDSVKFRLPKYLHFPLFIKPIRGGCSKGITKRNLVYSEDTCKSVVKDVVIRTQQPVLVEQFLSGREFTVGILGNNPPFMLPIIEFIFDSLKTNYVPFRSFKNKMNEETKEATICPATLTKIEQNDISDLALRTYREIGCRDYARIDIRCDNEGTPYVLEVNAIPSLIPHVSSFAEMARTAGISFNKLIGEILLFASMRSKNSSRIYSNLLR